MVVNLAVLGYFKYFNFGVDTLNAILERCGWPTLRAAEVILPVGISFYIFQAMSYVVDVYRDDAPRSESFVDMAAYIALFPQLVAGPIIRYKDLAGQLRRPDPAPDGVAYGLRRFAVGLCRKVLIADTVAPIAAAAFSMAEPSAVDAWLGVLAYSIQLYFDFSVITSYSIHYTKLYEPPGPRPPSCRKPRRSASRGRRPHGAAPGSSRCSRPPTRS